MSRACKISGLVGSALLIVVACSFVYWQNGDRSLAELKDLGFSALWQSNKKHHIHRFPLTHHGGGPNSMYCWAFTQMHGYEPALLALQQQNGWGLFSCNAHLVLSTLTGSTHGVGTHGLGHNPSYMCEGEGKKYACNAQLFVKAWDHIVKVRRYFHYDWTVKVDPDAVFFPGRLKQLLARVGDGQVLYLGNSKASPSISMLGPIEVVSRGAMFRYMHRHQECVWAFSDRIWKTGEDDFMEECFRDVLKVQTQLHVSLLHNANNEVKQCDGEKVVYHAFKDPSIFSQCHQHASVLGIGW